MRLTLLGTGCPVVSERRYDPAHLVRTERSSLLVDCGSGVTQRLLAAGCPGREIDAVLLTHLHTDHIIDLYQLIISSWHQGRAKAQKVYGPKGTRRYIEDLMELWRTEREQRIAHELRPSTAAFDMEIEEIAHGDVIAFNDLDVKAIEVDHRPVRNAFGYAFEDDGSRLVFSGDTAPCETLASAARGGADVLLHEVFIHRELPVRKGVRTEAGISNVASYHTPSGEIGKIARDAAVRLLVLTHFMPPDFDPGALLDEIGGDFSGPIVIGEDGMTIDIAKRRVISGDTALSLGDPLPAGR